VIVVDASAIVAIITREPEADALTEGLGRASEITTSPLAVYEATLGLVRVLRRSVEDAEADVMEFLRLAHIVVQPIQPETATSRSKPLLATARVEDIRRGSTLATVSFTLRPRSAGLRFFRRATISRRQISWPRPERLLLSVHPNLTAGLGVSISRGRTAEGNRDRVVGR
jgi:uncharacterized protein with PIN domain